MAAVATKRKKLAPRFIEFQPATAKVKPSHLTNHIRYGVQELGLNGVDSWKYVRKEKGLAQRDISELQLQQTLKHMKRHGRLQVPTVGVKRKKPFGGKSTTLEEGT